MARKRDQKPKLSLDSFQFWFLKKGLGGRFLDQDRIVLKDAQDFAQEEAPYSKIKRDQKLVYQWIAYRVNDVLKDEGYSFIETEIEGRKTLMAIKRNAMTEHEAFMMKRRGALLAAADLRKFKRHYEEACQANARTADTTAFDVVIEKILEMTG